MRLELPKVDEVEDFPKKSFLSRDPIATSFFQGVRQSQSQPSQGLPQPRAGDLRNAGDDDSQGGRCLLIRGFGEFYDGIAMLSLFLMPKYCVFSDRIRGHFLSFPSLAVWLRDQSNFPCEAESQTLFGSVLGFSDC